MVTCVAIPYDVSILVQKMVDAMLCDYDFLDDVVVDAVDVHTYNLMGKTVSDLHVGLLVKSTLVIDDSSIGGTDSMYLTLLREWVMVDPTKPPERMEGRVTDIDRLIRVRLDIVNNRKRARKKSSKRKLM